MQFSLHKLFENGLSPPPKKHHPIFALASLHDGLDEAGAGHHAKWPLLAEKSMIFRYVSKPAIRSFETAKYFQS